ncbi:hypothetical protein BDF22DRAFT_744555 [Syncephalis plumigaleata]|nr:hypothetical protein BDF22DRAFT_744555 [Syncephalis plumigaleata]
MTSLDKSHHLRTQMASKSFSSLSGTTPGSVTTVQNKIRAKRPFQLMAQKTNSVPIPLHSITGSTEEASPPSDRHCRETSFKVDESTMSGTVRRSVSLSTKAELHQLPALLRAQKLIEAEQQGEVNIETDTTPNHVTNTTAMAKQSLKPSGSRPGILHKRRSQSVSAVMDVYTSQLDRTSRDDAPPQAHDPASLEADAACFEHAFSSYAEWAKSTFAGQVSDADPRRMHQHRPHHINIHNKTTTHINYINYINCNSTSSSSSFFIVCTFTISLDNLQLAMPQSSVQSSMKSNQLVKPSPLRAVCSPRSPSSSRLRSSSVANPTIHFCLLRIVLSARDYVTIRVPIDISLSNLTHMVINKCLRCGRHGDDLKHRLFIWERSDPDLTLGVVNDAMLSEVLLPKPSSILANEKYTHAEKPVILYWT